MSQKTHVVTSPVMGVFYRSASPDAPALVEIGQSVKADDAVCLIESMKIFTELTAGHSGTIDKILVENEEPVMKNQPLMEIIVQP